MWNLSQQRKVCAPMRVCPSHSRSSLYRAYDALYPPKRNSQQTRSTVCRLLFTWPHFGGAQRRTETVFKHGRQNQYSNDMLNYWCVVSYSCVLYFGIEDGNGHYRGRDSYFILKPIYFNLYALIYCCSRGTPRSEVMAKLKDFL